MIYFNRIYPLFYFFYWENFLFKHLRKKIVSPSLYFVVYDIAHRGMGGQI
jgi:hypothetical protein